MDAQLYKKFNVLEICSDFGFAGGFKNIFTFSKYLNRDIFNIFAAAYIKGGTGEMRLKEAGIEYLVSEKDPDKILEYIKNKNIDVVHFSRSGGTVPLETRLIKGVKKINKDTVIVERNVFGKYDPECFGDIVCSLFQSMMHLNERFLPAAGIPFDAGRMQVFYNMIDGDELEKYRLTSEQIIEYRKKLHVAEDEFLLGKIGRAHIAKWGDLILDMMPYLVRLVPKVKFAVIGMPASRIKRIAKSKLRNHFIILPETADEREVYAFYQAIDLLAHSSKIGECNGNTINEAMYWKKPVVVNSTPNKDNGQLEQVVHMETGIVANYPQTYARAIEFLYKNPEKRLEMGANAHEQILMRNNPKLITSRLEKIFIGKLIEKGKQVAPQIEDYYNNVDVYPDASEIKNYAAEYRKRLDWEFGTLSNGERFMNFARWPKKFFYKFKDFAEHKLLYK